MAINVVPLTSKIFYPCAMLTEMEEKGQIQDGSAAAHSFFYHVTRVATMSRQYADYCGLKLEEQDLYYVSGLIHDLGKIGDKEIIKLWATHKKLKGEKRKRVRYGHVDKNNLKKGLEISRIDLQTLPEEAISVALCHHVRAVTGEDSYPERSYRRLPKITKVIGIIDAFEAIISTLRPYNKITKEGQLLKPITWTQAIRRLSKDVECGKFEEDLFWEVSEALTSSVPLNIVHIPNLLGHYV